MSNKSQLQLNNTDLQSILSTVMGLPTQESVKHGKYVWNKWKIESKQVTLSFSVLNSSSPYQLKVDCDNEIALKIATASSFVGLHGVWNGTGYYEFPDANTLRIYDGSNIYNFTSVYDATTNIFSVTSATGIGNTSQFADCTHTMQAGTFEGFAVSDNSTAYPDGGTQDGYWYEKVNEGITGIDYGRVLISSATNSITINHNLGKIPSRAYIVPYYENGIDLVMHGIAVSGNGNPIVKYGTTYIYNELWMYNQNNSPTVTGTALSTPSSTVTESTVTFYYSSSYPSIKFSKGCEYVWFVIE